MIDNTLLHTFNIDHLSEIDGKRYSGTFTTKKLSIRGLTQLGVRKAQLSGGLHFDPDNPGQGLDFNTDYINGMLAHLEISITEAPTWWDVDELTDMSILTEIYKEVVSFENNFPGRADVPGGNSQERSSQAQAEANPAGVAEQVVAGQVQAALEP